MNTDNNTIKQNNGCQPLALTQQTELSAQTTDITVENPQGPIDPRVDNQASQPALGCYLLSREMWQKTFIWPWVDYRSIINLSSTCWELYTVFAERCSKMKVGAQMYTQYLNLVSQAKFLWAMSRPTNYIDSQIRDLKQSIEEFEKKLNQ